MTLVKQLILPHTLAQEHEWFKNYCFTTLRFTVWQILVISCGRMLFSYKLNDLQLRKIKKCILGMSLLLDLWVEAVGLKTLKIRFCENVNLGTTSWKFSIWLNYYLVKGTICLQKEMGDCSCLMQLWTWFQVSDYHNFWNNKRWKPYDIYSKHHYLFYM